MRIIQTSIPKKKLHKHLFFFYPIHIIHSRDFGKVDHASKKDNHKGNHEEENKDTSN